MNARADVEDAARELAGEMRRAGLGGCRSAVVLGSGLGALAKGLAERRAVDGEELPSLPRGRVPGHAGVLVKGTLDGAPVLLQLGRVHLYEGCSAAEVARAVRVFAELGVERLILTNAAGSLVPDWGPGTLMRVVDHVGLQGAGSLLPAERGAGEVYDANLGAALEAAAAEVGERLERGVYAGLLGPAYETPAEIRMLQGLGAQAVGMSTVQEACAARAAGLEVACLSLLTNHAAGLSPEPLRHEDVVSASDAAAARLVAILRRALTSPG